MPHAFTERNIRPLSSRILRALLFSIVEREGRRLGRNDFLEVFISAGVDVNLGLSPSCIAHKVMELYAQSRTDRISEKRR